MLRPHPLAAFLLYLFYGVASANAQNPANVPVPREESWWVSRHEDVLQRVKSELNADLILVGDSITQNYEKTGPPPNEDFAPIWTEFFSPHQALNLGYSGDQTQNVLWRVAHGEVAGLSPAHVVLLIGTNNTANTTGPQTAEQVTIGVEAVVVVLHVALPRAKVLLIEILPSAVSAVKSAKDAAVNMALRTHYQHSQFVTTMDLSSLYSKGGDS